MLIDDDAYATAERLYTIIEIMVEESGVWVIPGIVSENRNNTIADREGCRVPGTVPILALVMALHLFLVDFISVLESISEGVPVSLPRG